MFLILISLLLTSHLATATTYDYEVDDETPFSYDECAFNGPENWGLINPQWQICNTGRLQSPIDLVDKCIQVSPKLGKLKKHYKPAPAIVKNRGHDIQVKWKSYAGKISIKGKDYNLTQCHWHSPSEHTFNGIRYDLELHIVHVSSNGRTAVIGILYRYGHPDRFLSKVLPRIDSNMGIEGKEIGIVNPRDIKFGSKKYYRYVGSLTTPPCTEGVVWTIVKKVRQVSREQVKALREAINDGYEANARPLQELNGRPVFLYSPGRKHIIVN